MKLRLTLLTAATLTALSFSAHAVEKGTIMIMVNSLDNPYYASEAKGASEKAQQLGYKTTILSHGEDVKKQNELIDTAIGKKVQGIILDNADSTASVAAIEKAKQDWEAQAEEAKRQAKLSPEEKAAEEQKKKDEQIAELQAKLLKSDLQKKATASLEKDGYPVGLAELLDYTSEEAMEKSLSKLTDTFKGSLQAAVESRLRGKTPAGLGNAASAENMLRDQIARNIRGL